MCGKRMTIFIGESDQWRHRPLYLAILEHLKAAGCRGATVTRGVAGFGAHSHVKTASVLALSVDLPVVITVVDSSATIDRLAPEIATMLGGGLITLEDVDIYFHSAAFRGGLPDLRVGDVMQSRPESAHPDTPITDVIARLVGRDYTALPVVNEDNHVLGMVSDRDMLEAGLTRLSVPVHRAAGPDLVRSLLTDLKNREGRVRDAMRSPAITVTAETRLQEAAHLMHVNELKRLPVVDASGRLCGMLGRLDILRSIVSGYERRTVRDAGGLPQEHRTVGEIMEPDVPTVKETTPLADVVGKLLGSDVKRVVVCDGQGHPAGIITDTDIVARVNPEARPGILTILRSRWNSDAQRQVRHAFGERAGDVMTGPVISVRAAAPVIEALTLAVEHKIKRLPVVNDEGALVGFVARPALLAACLDLQAAATNS